MQELAFYKKKLEKKKKNWGHVEKTGQHQPSQLGALFGWES